MADSVTVTNMPDSGSKHRVAFDLMVRIANKETSPSPQDARQYFLKLYEECRDVVY
jgi:hypothetical protein